MLVNACNDLIKCTFISFCEFNRMQNIIFDTSMFFYKKILSLKYGSYSITRVIVENWLVFLHVVIADVFLPLFLFIFLFLFLSFFLSFLLSFLLSFSFLFSLSLSLFTLYLWANLSIYLIFFFRGYDKTAWKTSFAPESFSIADLLQSLSDNRGLA